MTDDRSSVVLKDDLCKGTNEAHNNHGKGLQHGGVRLLSKPSSIILRIKQHPISIVVQLPEDVKRHVSYASSSPSDSTDSESNDGATQSSSSSEGTSHDEDSDAESSYNGCVEEKQPLCTDDSFPKLESAHASENRSMLIQHMAEVALNVKLEPAGLYLAVQLLDLYWNHHHERGKRLDCVQLQVLALTCVHVASNRFNTIKRTPDEFCQFAGVAEGTVKGCMIVKQQASLETLLGGSENATKVSTWLLWRKMGHPSNQQHLLQFIRLLKGSDYGNAHFAKEGMNVPRIPTSPSTPSLEVLTANAAKVVNALLTSAQGCASTTSGKKRPLNQPIVFVPVKRCAARG